MKKQQTVSFGPEYQQMVEDLESQYPQLKYLKDSQKYIRIFEAGVEKMNKNAGFLTRTADHPIAC